MAHSDPQTNPQKNYFFAPAQYNPLRKLGVFQEIIEPMYRSILLSFFLLLAALGMGQQVQWLTASPINYEVNPNWPTHLVCASDADHAYVARSTELSYLYQTVFGSAVIEQRNALGETNWSFSLGDSVKLQAMASDPDGNVIIGGRFFRALHLGSGSVLPVVNGNTFPETFLIALDIDGNLLWQRNITPSDPTGTDVESITFDPQGRAWYATCDFTTAQIKRLDVSGNDVEAWPILNAMLIGSLSFDAQGSLYVSGATSTPGITVNGTLYPMTKHYNFFVTRMDADGTSQWLRSAEDEVFHRPRVKADAFGHVYLLYPPRDSLTFAGTHFHGPEWNSTFILARLDSMGTLQWGFQPPLDTPFAGQFDVGEKDVLGVDADGNAVILGLAFGVINWGNNVLTNLGTTQERAITLLQVDSTGTPQWELHGGSGEFDQMQGLHVLPDGICHIAVRTRNAFPFGPFTAEVSTPHLVVARIALGITTGMEKSPSAGQGLVAFPSPFSSEFTISAERFSGEALDVILRDGTGRIVSLSHRLEALGNTLAAGSYFVEVRQGENRWHGRVVKQ